MNKQNLYDELITSTENHIGQENKIIESWDLSLRDQKFNNLIKESENEPTDPALWSRAIAAAKDKYDVYPSAYANAYASKWYKEKGGGWRKEKKKNEMSEESVYKNSGLGKWFEEDWVDISRKENGKHPECGDSSDSGSRGKDGKRAYPKCTKSSKAKSMSSKEKESAVRRKREDGKPKGGKPRNVSTDVNESFIYDFSRFDLNEQRSGNEQKSDIAGVALDLLGFVPVVGELADIANATRYIKRGNYFLAALSLISLVPEAGDIPAKLVKYGTSLSKASKSAKISKVGTAIAKMGTSDAARTADLVLQGTKKLAASLNNFLVKNKSLIDDIFDKLEESENEFIKKNIQPHLSAIKKSIEPANLMDNVGEVVRNVSFENKLLEAKKRKKKKTAKDPISGIAMTWPASDFFGYGYDDQMEGDEGYPVVASGGVSVDFGDSGSTGIVGLFGAGQLGIGTVGGE